MGKLEDEWEFWRPFLFGAVALALLALVTVGMLSHHRDKQQSHFGAAHKEAEKSIVDKENDLDAKVAVAREEALANLEDR